MKMECRESDLWQGAGISTPSPTGGGEIPIASTDSWHQCRVWSYDRRLFLRSVGTTALLGAGVWTLIVVSDEAGSSAAMRGARLCALVPLLQILSVLWVLESARRRGEQRALEALGVAPLRVAAAVLGAAWLVGAAACLCVASSWVDPRSLFPVIADGQGWTRAGEVWLDAARGVEVDALGRIRLGVASAAPLALSRSDAALALLLPLCALAPLWAALRCAARERWLVALGAAALAVTTLHAAAAQRVPSFALAGCALPLGLHCLWLSRPRARRPAAAAGP
jgi:hypothetical protein